MNMLKKGPEIKLSELKVPSFLLDLYYDLRDRHLLPLAILLIVAIIVVPIALSRSSGSGDTESSESAIASPSTAGGQSGQLIARSAPGLRDYRRRLARLHAKDPFNQQYTGKGQSSSSSTAGEGGSSETPPVTETPESSPPTAQPEGTPGPGKLTYFSYAIDVRVVPGSPQEGPSEKSAGKATVRHNLPELTMLPGRETPAVIYMGSTRDAKKALMLVSSDVKAIFGDAKCVLGSESCELLAMEPGVPETFVYGGNGRTFKIELLKIHLVESDKLNRAPLGNPKKHGKNGR
jgi:hypothetical protein